MNVTVGDRPNRPDLLGRSWRMSPCHVPNDAATGAQNIYTDKGRHRRGPECQDFAPCTPRQGHEMGAGLTGPCVDLQIRACAREARRVPPAPIVAREVGQDLHRHQWFDAQDRRPFPGPPHERQLGRPRMLGRRDQHRGHLILVGRP